MENYGINLEIIFGGFTCVYIAVLTYKLKFTRQKCRLTMLPPNRCERPILVIVPPLAPSSSVSSVLVGFWRQERTYWPIFFSLKYNSLCIYILAQLRDTLKSGDVCVCVCVPF